MNEEKSIIGWWKDDRFKGHLFFQMKRSVLFCLVMSALFFFEDMNIGRSILIFQACFGAWMLGVVNRMIWEGRMENTNE